MGAVTLTTLPLPQLLAAFASSEPVPGGGSAAALAGAVGVSLLQMVAALPRSRSGAAEETAALAQSAARLAPIRDLLVALVERDSEAYAAVAAAFRLPKATDAEKDARRRAIQAATRHATEVPLETMRACRAALEEAAIVAAAGNANASSDVAVAHELLTAALRGARLNVDINLKSLADTAFVAAAAAEADALSRP